jgi:hypothetical protein
VWRVYIDPQWLDHLVEQWSNRYGTKRIVEWLTYRPRQIAWAVREYEQAVAAGDVTHNGNPTFVRHIGNAQRRMLTVLDDRERPMHTLAKDASRSPRKIDAAMAAVLSWKARGDALQAGVVAIDQPPPPNGPERTPSYVTREMGDGRRVIVQQVGPDALSPPTRPSADFT